MITILFDDHREIYRPWLLSTLKKTNPDVTFSSADMNTIESDLRTAVDTLHNKHISHGGVQEDCVLIIEKVMLQIHIMALS